MRAILSVFDKTGIVEFARGLRELGWELYSTGGTQSAVAAAGVEVCSISQLTGFPEILGGRVKTIHPAVIAGILADRQDPKHASQLAEHSIQPVDLVAVNLYPFVETVERATAGGDAEAGAASEAPATATPSGSLAEILESIDVGGVTLVRAAAKNFHQVVVVVRPQDYAAVLQELRGSGHVSASTRCGLAMRAFQHTATYDTYIAQYFSQLAGPQFPDEMTLPLQKCSDLRYGENPHQRAAFYRTGDTRLGGPSLAEAKQHHGRELSYNNLLDADAAWALVSEFAAPAVAIVKHNNPCGVGCAATPPDAYRKAYAADPDAAMGGVVACNRPVDRELAEATRGHWIEVLIAPGYDAEALRVLRRYKSQDLRILELPLPVTDSSPSARLPCLQLQYRHVLGGMLAQTRDTVPEDEVQLRVVTKRRPTLEELTDLQFAWRVVKQVRSNAVVVAKHLAVLGVGAGQMKRVDSVHLALRIAEQGGSGRAQGAVLASDGLFPFDDWVEVAKDAGVTAAIQPGGAKNDEQIIATCDRLNIAMVFTAQRHFRH